MWCRGTKICGARIGRIGLDMWCLNVWCRGTKYEVPNMWCLVVPKSVVPGLVGLAWICGAQMCGAKYVVPNLRYMRYMRYG